MIENGNPTGFDEKAFDKEATVQKMFSSIARHYDLNNTLLSFGLHHQWKKRTIEVLRLQSGEKVLDVGAGTADLSILAADKVGKTGLVITTDLNEPMLQIGKEKLRNRKLVQAFCALANAEKLPFPNQSFDALLTGFCMRNVSHLDTALQEIHRVLKPGGRMACLDFSTPTHTLLRTFYDFYSFTLLPKIGQWVSKDQTGIYKYLPDSIRKFPNQQTLQQKIEKSGFRMTAYENLSGGIVAIHTGTR